jgi:hypothetical protein
MINSKFSTYERVILKPSKTKTIVRNNRFSLNLLVTIIRPVVLLGPLADIARDQLLNQYSDQYELPGKIDF